MLVDFETNRNIQNSLYFDRIRTRLSQKQIVKSPKNMRIMVKKIIIQKGVSYKLKRNPQMLGISRIFLMRQGVKMKKKGDEIFLSLPH